MIAAGAITRDPRRLAALCELWRSAGKEVWITLEGRSMTPGILPGSRLRLRCRPWEMQPGEVIAYRREGVLVVHRLLQSGDGTEGEGRHLLFQGDANEEPDPPVGPECVVGLVVEVQPPSAPMRVRRALRSAVNRWRGVSKRVKNRLRAKS
jgi:hypothetical protein